MVLLLGKYSTEPKLLKAFAEMDLTISVVYQPAKEPNLLSTEILFSKYIHW